MPKDRPKIPPFAGLAPPFGLDAEQIAALRKVGAWPSPENLKALRDQHARLEPLLEPLRRVKRESELREQENTLRARIAHAQRQIEAWQERKATAEAELAGFLAAYGRGGRTAVAQTTSPAPVAAPIKPAEDPQQNKTKLDHARRALSTLWPNGPPPQLAVKARLAEINDWLEKDARERGLSPPPKIERDTLLRALGQRK